MKKFKFLEHTADIKFLASGSSLEKAFENSALAMFSSMYSGKIRKKIKKKIQVKGKDNSSLLYNFLEELLFLLDTENFFLSSCKVKINEKKLKLEAELEGDKAENYKIELDVKAVTYNSMFVRKLNQGSATPIKWICQVVLDV